MGSLVLSEFAQSTVGMVAFEALSGGIGAELSGGNFWQGAVTGEIVAGLNYAMHKGGDNKGGKKERDTRHNKPAPKELEGFPDAKKIP